MQISKENQESLIEIVLCIEKNKKQQTKTIVVRIRFIIFEKNKTFVVNLINY